MDNDNDPSPPAIFNAANSYNHGTKMAGAIGACGNNGVGITGVCWKVSLMSFRCIPENVAQHPRYNTEKTISAAMAYALAMGADIVNCSWGKSHATSAFLELMKKGSARGVLFVAAAGNGGADTDRTPVYPACFDLPNLLSIMGSDREDRPLRLFQEIVTNFGRRLILAASPGSKVWTTTPTDTETTQRLYGRTYDASIATAVASGVAALVKSAAPDLQAPEIIRILKESADPAPGLENFCAWGARLNAGRAVKLARETGKSHAIDELF